MPDVFLPAVNPVDESGPHPFSGLPQLGGLLGDGDLTSNDGDSSGFEAWNSGAGAFSGEPGYDVFTYEVDTAALPAGATLTGYRFELTARLLSESSPQSYAAPTVSGNWSEAGGTQYTKNWFVGDDFYTYATYHDVIEPAATLAPMLADGTARLTFSAAFRNTNVTDAPSPVRVTMGGIRVYYNETVIRTRPHLRHRQRGDGLGGSTAPRHRQHASRQGSIRGRGFL